MAAVIATVVFILLGVFQIIVALGAPYGQYVWGGQHKVLPKGLRVGSVIAVGYFLNAISRSKPERFVMTPVTAVLAACAFVITLA